MLPLGPYPVLVGESHCILNKLDLDTTGCLHLGTYREQAVEPGRKGGRRRGCLQLTYRSHSSWQDDDLRNLVRVISACTLGLWAFAAGLLIGTFLFS